MFNALFSGLAWLLNFFYTLVPNYAVAIALLTVAVMVVFFPLTAKSTRSMAAMSKLSPEMKRIQQKYKNDKMKQNEEVMALFKEHNVTPFGGCVPILIQLPVLLVMYRVLFGLTHKGPTGAFKPKYLHEGQKLYDSLVGKHKMKSFGMDLSVNASDALHKAFTTAIPYLVLIVLVVGTGYYQQRMMLKRNPQQQQDDNPMARQMQTMTKIYPLMYLIFGFTLPASMNIYFIVSSGFRIGQQWLIYRLDPSLLPSHDARTIASREVNKPDTNDEKPSTSGNRPGKSPGDGGRGNQRALPGSNGRKNGAGGGASRADGSGKGATGAGKSGNGTAPARPPTANRATAKKKRRR